MTTKPGSASAAELVLQRGDSSSNVIAIRVLESGVWAEYTWADVARTVCRIADLLTDSGVTPGASVAVVSGSRAEWALCVWAIEAVGATAVAVSCQVDETTLGNVVQRQPAFWILEGLEAYDRVLGAMPGLGRALVFDDVELPGGSEQVRRWTRDVVASDPSGDAALLERTRAGVASLDLDSPALVVAEAGDRCLTHRDLVATQDTCGIVLEPRDEYLAFLPPSWQAEAFTLAGSHAVSGATVSLGSRVGGGLAELAAVQPTVVQAPGEWWDAVAERVTRQAAEPAPLARKALQTIARGEPGGGFLVKMARRSITQVLGLNRVRAARSLGPVASATDAMMRGLAIPLGEPLAHPVGSAREAPSDDLSKTDRLEEAK